MRVLQLGSHLRLGGITTYVATISEALTQRGHAVCVASGAGPAQARLQAQGIQLWTLPLDTSAECSPQVMWSAWQLRHRLRQQPVDLIHAHTRVGQVVADWLSRRTRTPYVTTWHGFFRRRLGRRLWPCTGDVTIAISEPVALHLRDTFGVPAQRVRVIPHGIDVSRYQQPVSVETQAALRAKFGLSGGPILGTVSRLVPSKGVDQLIRAFSTVVERVSTARLLIVGDGPDRGRLEGLTRRLGDRIRFAGWLDDPRPALALMDAFVFLPATEEGFGLSLLEAMASGRPIVAIKRGGGATWVLEDSQAALIVPPDDTAALAEAMRRVAQDRGLAEALAQRAQVVAKARYDLPPMIDAIERVYREAVQLRNS